MASNIAEPGQLYPADSMLMRWRHIRNIDLDRASPYRAERRVSGTHRSFPLDSNETRPDAAEREGKASLRGASIYTLSLLAGAIITGVQSGFNWVTHSLVVIGLICALFAAILAFSVFSRSSKEDKKARKYARLSLIIVLGPFALALGLILLGALVFLAMFGA